MSPACDRGQALRQACREEQTTLALAAQHPNGSCGQAANAAGSAAVGQRLPSWEPTGQNAHLARHASGVGGADSQRQAAAGSRGGHWPHGRLRFRLALTQETSHGLPEADVWSLHGLVVRITGSAHVPLDGRVGSRAKPRPRAARPRAGRGAVRLLSYLDRLRPGHRAALLLPEHRLHGCAAWASSRPGQRDPRIFHFAERLTDALRRFGSLLSLPPPMTRSPSPPAASQRANTRLTHRRGTCAGSGQYRRGAVLRGSFVPPAAAKDPPNWDPAILRSADVPAARCSHG